MENDNINEVLNEEEIHDYTDEIVDVIKSSKNKKELKIKLTDYHDNDIAGALEFLTIQERKKLYNALSDEELSNIFAYIDEDVEKYIAELDAAHAADILEEMDADDAIDILQELDEQKAQEIIELIEPEAKEDIELINSYSEDQFGSLMTTNFVVVNHNQSVRETMKSLIKQAKDNDNISTLYVINEDETFYGALDLKNLICARDGDDLEPFIITSYPFVYDDESISENLQDITEYSEDSIPVLNREDKIIGVITSQDLIEAVDEDMGEDYAKLAGLTDEEEIDESLKDSIKKRLPWLLALLFLSMFVSTIVGLFETVVEKVALVVCFQSLILGMAGNVGTQSLAVTIRASTDDELEEKEKWKLVLKEVKVGTCNGLILGGLSFIFLGLYIYFFKENNLEFAFLVSLCVGISLLLAMLISSFIGTATPLLLDKIHIDPAVASGPLITTINDLVAVVTYYSLVWILLINVFKIV